jgi:hypothetical protein
MRLSVVFGVAALAGAGCASHKSGAPAVAPGVGGAGGVGGEAAGIGGFRWLGRVDTTNLARPRFSWSGTGFAAQVTGGSVVVLMNNAGPFVFRTVIDGVPSPALTVNAGDGSYTIASDLPLGAHTIAFTRQTEGVYGDSTLVDIMVNGGAFIDQPLLPERLIEVVGASVSCGYGDLGTAPCGFSFDTESAYDAYESVAALAVKADVSVVAISGRGMYRNSDGTTTGTMPEMYLRTVASTPDPVWDFRATPQAVIINLGKNDLAVGDPGQPFVDTYLAFTRMLRERYPDVLIICTTGPNLGATAHALQLAYVQGVVATRTTEGDPAIVLVDWPEEAPAETGCDAHPTAAKHRTMGTAVAAVLRDRLGW